MGIVSIRRLGDPVLREAAREVESFDASLRALADDMIQTMYDAPGVGLAGPQVGRAIRFFVFDAGDSLGPRAVANPVLSEFEGEQLEDEGCLSIPGLYWQTPRAMRVRLDGFGLRGEPITFQGEGLSARIFQHETDHVSGMLFIDRLSDEERRQAMAEFRRRELDPEPRRMPRSG